MLATSVQNIRRLGINVPVRHQLGATQAAFGNQLGTRDRHTYIMNTKPVLLLLAATSLGLALTLPVIAQDMDPRWMVPVSDGEVPLHPDPYGYTNGMPNGPPSTLGPVPAMEIQDYTWTPPAIPQGTADAEDGAAAAPASSSASKPITISSLEKRFFDVSYAKETTPERLERLEKFVFGGARTGTDEERFKNLIVAALGPNKSTDKSELPKSPAGSPVSAMPSATPEVGANRDTISQSTIAQPTGQETETKSNLSKSEATPTAQTNSAPASNSDQATDDLVASLRRGHSHPSDKGSGH